MRITGSLLAIGLAVGGALAPATLPDEPLQLVVLAPVTAPPTAEGLLSASELGEMTTPGGILAMQLGQLGGREVTLGIDPMILASIRLLGSEAPESAVSWLARLAEAPNSSFALQWADANPLVSLQSIGVVRAAPQLSIDPTRFAPAESDIGGLASENPELPPLPTNDDLVAWDHDYGSIAWPATPPSNPTDLAGLREHGFEAVIIDSTNVPAMHVRSPHVAFGMIDGVVSNNTLSSLLNATIAAPSEEAWALAFDGLVAALDQLAESGDRVVAATLGRITPGAPWRVSRTLDALAALDRVALSPLSAVFEQPAVSSDLELSTPGADSRAETFTTLHRLEVDVIRFSRIIDEPGPLLAARRAKLLALLSTGWREDDPLWHAAAEAYLADGRSILGAVTIQDSSTINLLAANGPFPVTVRNDLAHSVTVYITVRPDRPILSITDTRVELKIPANTQAKAFVPVQVVANGHVRATVSISASDHTMVSTPTRVDVNVQAGWEEPVTIIVGGVIGVMLLAGIWRTVRHRERIVSGTPELAEQVDDE